jgi:DNA-binding CsgD family transcriptional regulator
VRDGEEALQIARQIDWRAGEAGALVYLAFGHGPRGDYARALERAELGFTIAREIEHSVWLVGAHIALGAIALDLLALARACEHLETALVLARQLGSFFVQNIAGLLVSTCIAQRDIVRAAAVLATTFAPEMPMETQGQRAIWCARAELALASNEFSLALQIVDRLIEHAPHAAHAGSGSIPRVWLLRGEALAAVGSRADAEAALLAAEEGARRIGLPPMRWRIQCSLGRLYQREGQRKQAETAFAAARATVDELAAGVPDSDLREAFVHAAARLIPRPPPPTPRRVLKDTFDGLTEREREIAVLVAQGQSNRAIAEALVLSEHTVARHVSHILSKLSVGTRAQVAAWASEKGLIKPH